MRINKNGVIRKTNLRIFLFALFVCGGLEYLYLLDGNDIQIAGLLSLKDLDLILVSLWGLYTWASLLNLPSPVYRYKFWLFAVILLSIFSSYQSLNLYNQPFLMGLRPQREWIVWSLLYFPLTKLLYNNKNKYEQIKNMIIVLGTIELVLFIFQYLISDSITFLHVMTSMRYESIRYYYQPILLDLLFFIKLDDFINGNKHRILSCVYIGAILFEVMVVQKFRMTSIALIIVAIVGIILVKKNFASKLGYFVIAAFIAVVLLNTQIVQDTLQAIFSGDSTLTIRNDARTWYFLVLKDHLVLGGGYPSILNESASNAAGLNDYIYLVDNGIWGFLYIYGGIGLFWAISLWFKMLKTGYLIYNKMSHIYFVLFPLFFIVTSTNEVHWYWMNGFMILVIFMCMTDGILLKQEGM